MAYFPSGWPLRAGPVRLRAGPVFPAWLLRLVAVGFVALNSVSAADVMKKTFRIDAGEAPATLRQFSAQAGGDRLLYSSDAVKGVKTHATEGELTPREALERMLAGSELIVSEDAQTGALTVHRAPSVKSSPKPRTQPGAPPERRTVLAPDASGNTTPAAGTITGRVRNEATGAFLEGARVEARGTHRYTVTDREGRYWLSVPSGPALLVVTYAGLDAQNRQLTFAAGEVIAWDVPLTSQIYALDKFVVSGPREGNAAALTAQREAANVKNVVSSDAFGNAADGNIGDLLQQIPGVTADYSAQDVRSIRIRGIDGSLSSTTMDGDLIASSQSAGTGREFEFEQASLNLIESIEVTKAPTPDMDAASIGGNVNLVTKSAFDRADPRYFTYSVGGVYRSRYQTRSGDPFKEPFANFGPSFNFTYADRFGAKQNIGLLLTGTYHSQPGGDTAVLMNYQNTLTEPYYIYSVNAPRPAGGNRTRLSGGAKLDYKLSERTTFSLNAAYNHFHENNDTRAMTLSTSQAVANFRPGYSGRYSEIIGNANANSAITVNTNDKSGRTWQLAPSARHRFPGLDIDYGASLSNSETYYDHSPNNRHYASKPKGNISGLTLRSVGFIIDRTQDPKWPTITQTTGPNVYNLANYNGGTLRITQPDREGEDEVRTLRFNARKDLGLRWPTWIKIGGNWNERHRGLANASRRYDYTGSAGTIGRFLDTSDKWSDSDAGYARPPWPSATAIARDVIERPQFWREDTAYAVAQQLSNERAITETVTAGYAMGQVRFGPVSVLSGVRIEDTRTNAVGPIQTNGAYRGALQRKKAGYNDAFPSLHLRYEPLDGFVARASYSTGIGRPNFDSLMPLEVVNETAQTINARNTGLQPQYADNFDLSVEYYFKQVGSVSANVFLKEVRDFFFSSAEILDGTDAVYGPDYRGWRLTTDHNGGHARYRGFEVSYQQMFTFLPKFWRGFGVYANYTQLDTRGDYGGASSTTQVEGFIPKTGNLAFTYLNRGWNIRLSAVWRSAYLITTNVNPALTRWREANLRISLKTKYSLSQRLAVFCDIADINRAPAYEYFGDEERSTQTRIVVPKIVAGITGRF